MEFEGAFPKIGRRTVLLEARRLTRDRNAFALLALRDITERKNLDRQRELLLAREEALRKDAQAAARDVSAVCPVCFTSAPCVRG